MKAVKKGSWEVLRFKSLGDQRGDLIAINAFADIPFGIKRVYYMTFTKAEIKRGMHAHRNLDQVLIPVKGRVTVKVTDGFQEEEVLLNHHTMGLRISNLVWRDLYNFSSDCVLLTLASEVYLENDYIREFSEFQRAALTTNK